MRVAIEAFCHDWARWYSRTSDSTYTFLVAICNLFVRAALSVAQLMGVSAVFLPSPIKPIASRVHEVLGELT